MDLMLRARAIRVRKKGRGVMKKTMNDYVMEATNIRVREIEAAITRFRDCGVELSRFSIEERSGATHLCVDGVSRFQATTP